MDKQRDQPAAAASGLSPLKDAPQPRAPYFRSDDDANHAGTSTPPRLPLENKGLSFQYRGDIFGQHGAYGDANLYMSRLPSSRKGSILRPRVGSAYKVPGLKLAPMQQQQQQPPLPQQQHHHHQGKPRKAVGRKRQYALAVEAMASNAELRGSLLSDNVVPSLLSLVRTKDTTTLASCVATLCFLSSDPVGRGAMRRGNALPLLTALAPTLPPPHGAADGAARLALLHNFLATLANLTIEDAFESVFVKEKALESLLKHRRASPLAAQLCAFAVLNLSSPTYAFPRVDDVVRAIHECARDASLADVDRETLSRALYNVSCTRANQPKLVEGEAVAMLRAMLLPVAAAPSAGKRRSTTTTTTTATATATQPRGSDALRLNALMTLWHVAETAPCRRALAKPDCIRAIVAPLRAAALPPDAQLRCVLMVLVRLSPDELARRRLGDADALDALAQLVARLQAADADAGGGDSDGRVDEQQQPREELVAVAYRLMALILSAPTAVESVGDAFLSLLLAFRHGAASDCSRYVLFSLASILWWNDSDERESDHATATATAPHRRPPTTTTRTTTSTTTTPHIDDLLDDPARLAPLLAHVEAGGFASDSPEAALQALLLYNLSFRYSKVDVARRASPRLRALAASSRHAAVLRVVCGTLFCLCQEYETHGVLHAAGVLADLPLLVARCGSDQDTQAMCLDVVCVVFDGRMLPRAALVALMAGVAPALVALCESPGGTALRASCAACFARFAALDECRAAMAAQQGVVRALAVLANEEHVPTLRLCVSAYSHLSRDAAVCAQLIASGIITSLTFLAAAPEEAVRRACAMTLCNLSTSESNVAALAAAGALRALLVIACVKSNDAETRRICMKAVVNLLRLPANVPRLCQDGLLWAFGLFTSAMEPKDFAILSDAFAALAFYPATRRGVVKPAVLAAMFPVLECPLSAATAKLLRGLSNALCDPPHAALLFHAGVLPRLLALVGEPASATVVDAGETRALVAQLLVLLFQSCADAASEFAQPPTLRAIARLLHTDHGDCGRCVAILLYQMSLHAATRAPLVAPLWHDDDSDAGQASLVAAVPELFARAARDTQALLVRLLFNVSSDPLLTAALQADRLVPCLWAAMPKRTAATDVAAFSAGLLRNLSCAPAAHAALMLEPATALLQRLFDVGDDACREDAAVCLGNLLVGTVNSHALLARSVLPMVLWLCSSRACAESRLLGSTVVRKLALAPGNAQALVDGGAISHLALLLQDGASRRVTTNCIATFCSLSRRSGAPALLASYGVIASVLELLTQEGDGDAAVDPLVEAMCVDLLAALAAFARADDPVESKLASILFRLIETDDGGGSAASRATSAAAAWQTDRGFLVRDASGSALAPPSPSRAHERVAAKPPVLRHTLYPVRFAGFSVDFTQPASSLDVRTIEPVFPSLSTIGEGPEAAPDGASSQDEGESSGGGVSGSTTPPSARRSVVCRTPPSSFAFSPLPMFAKCLDPFPATPSMAQQQQQSRD